MERAATRLLAIFRTRRGSPTTPLSRNPSASLASRGASHARCDASGAEEFGSEASHFSRKLTRFFAAPRARIAQRRRCVGSKWGIFARNGSRSRRNSLGEAAKQGVRAIYFSRGVLACEGPMRKRLEFKAVSSVLDLLPRWAQTRRPGNNSAARWCG